MQMRAVTCTCVNGSSASPYKTTFSSNRNKLECSRRRYGNICEIMGCWWWCRTNGGATGGGGGFISGWLTIPSGTTQLSVFVGGGGGNGGSGTGGTNGGGGTSGNGGGGGGRSAIQIGAVDYVTAGGGGGAASGCWCRGGGGGGGGQALTAQLKQLQVSVTVVLKRRWALLVPVAEMLQVIPAVLVYQQFLSRWWWWWLVRRRAWRQRHRQ